MEIQDRQPVGHYVFLALNVSGSDTDARKHEKVSLYASKEVTLWGLDTRYLFTSSFYPHVVHSVEHHVVGRATGNGEHFPSDNGTSKSIDKSSVL